MNYKKHYDNIINRATNRVIDGYTEKHHIVPRCLGGTDSNSNIVKLTAREHFVCHQLLVKMYPKHLGLVNAANMMCTASKAHSKNRMNNRLYEWLRCRLSKAQSIAQSGSKNNNYGKIWINNPVLRKSQLVLKSNTIPTGWYEGRVINFDKQKTIAKKTKKQYINNYTKLSKTQKEYNKKKRNYAEKKVAIELYEKYVAGEYKSVSAFYRSITIKQSRQALVQLWDRHIPEYSTRRKER